MSEVDEDKQFVYKTNVLIAHAKRVAMFVLCSSWFVTGLF